MYMVSNLFVAVAKLLDIVLSLYLWIVIIRALLSWVNPDPYNPIVRFLYQVTEP
ncbi:MAG: YggT family protein, partial [Pseudomonadota bacterium]|nr:YggT family protein [Pseudomonadota bacterium]